MYVTLIDNIIDKILDKLYLEGLAKDSTFRTIAEGKKVNIVEQRDKINKFIQNFMQTIDMAPIQKLIQNKENLTRILDIIKRYIAYYYFLSIAYYFNGTIKEFRNNLIQYSKLQETSPEFMIKNFFDTENNYQIIMFFKIIKDVSNIITMTELQRKTLNPLEVKDAVNFLKTLDTEYINNYLLMIVRKNNEEVVEINVHNLIKTIVFGEIYRNQERNMVFEILNDIEENKNEYTYIDIVITTDDTTDFENFRQIFIGEENMEIIAKDLFELVNDTTRVISVPGVEAKNNSLLEFNMITPIVDNFLRYHRDSERLDVDADKPFIMPLTSANNAKNVQMALLYQQRKKKENTKAQLIVNKIDAISDLYSDNVKKNNEITRDIKKYFQNPFSYRKAVMINYLDEVRVMNKIRNQGRRAMEGNEYYLELVDANRRAYFNFKDFQKYGTSLILTNEDPINVLRYSNIEAQNQYPNMHVDVHSVVSDSMINLVGLAIGPFDNGPIQCVKKENLVDIRTIKISYMKDGKVVTKSSDNGYKAFLKIIKHFYINTIDIVMEPTFHIINDFGAMKKMNPDIFYKIVYWIYDIEKDEFEMETYENIKSYNFQENIRFINALLYDKIIQFMNKKLVKLMNIHKNLPIGKIELLVEMFTNVNRLFLKQNEKRELIISEYLRNKPKEKSRIIEISDENKIPMPEFIPITESTIFRIKIDTINPLHPQEYVKLEAYTKEGQESIITRVQSKCQHENEWKELNKMKTENLNKYNLEVTDFIEKFAIETTELDFVCKICGQILPLKQYVQDGSFDNNTQKFVTAYVPLDVPLEEIREYEKYQLTIRYLDTLINRFSLITGTNMLVGLNTQVKQKRKALVKNIIDIIVKHNFINMRKKISDEERLDFMSKKFNIDKDLDSIFFFELEDSIFNFTPSGTEAAANLNRLKFNNILLYFILIFITELNGAQISMMFSDRIANIYTYLNYGPKLFGNLLVRKNINDMETVPINRYPVLCYLIFIVSYFLIQYKLWYYPATTSKRFNPVLQKVVINSFVDLINSISMDAGKMQNDYIYMLTTSKLYSHLNTTFKNNEIINQLKLMQARFSSKDTTEVVVPVASKEDFNKIYSIENPIKVVRKTIKIQSYKLSNGIVFDRHNDLLYHLTTFISDITNCPEGSYHKWVYRDMQIVCTICGQTGDQVTGEVDLLTANYYYTLAKIASTRRCLDGRLHDFIGKNGKFTCTHCKRSIGDKYNPEELDKLEESLNKLENQNIMETLQKILALRDEILIEETDREKLFNELVEQYKKNTGNKFYGQITLLVAELIDALENLIGVDTNLDISKYPVYLRDNVYIIDHAYDGSVFPEAIIFKEKEGKVIFKENHPYFKADVYYYTDNRVQIDVFYHAVTLKLLGYKEKHKDYVSVPRSNNYIIINPSIMQRLLTIGFETKYIDVGDAFNKNIKIIKDANLNYYQILDGLIREHIFKIKSIIDKISSIVYKVKYYQVPQESETILQLKATQEMDILVSKYAKLLKNFNIGTDNDIFDDWTDIRNFFIYEKVNWKETNVLAPENMYVNIDLINYYDSTSNLLVYYLVNQLLNILDSNPDRVTKINISQLYIEMINYIYHLYNTDVFKNSMEIKRFHYVLNGSEMMIDLLRKGQGLNESKELEQHLDEIQPDIVDLGKEEKEEVEDLKEEADALDIDTDYYAEEEGDYVEGGDYEE